MNALHAPQDGPSTVAGASSTSGAPTSTTTVPLIAESLEVRKVAVDRGGYRLTKRVRTHEVVVDEPLLHESVTVERCLVGRELADGDVPAVRYEGDTMIVPVVKEIVVTQTRLVLVEEIRIVRAGVTERDPQTFAVREEHIEIERLGGEPSATASS